MQIVNGQEPILEDNEKSRPSSPEDIEKNGDTIDFPAAGPIPTYTLAFGVKSNREPLGPVPEYDEMAFPTTTKPSPRNRALSYAETLTRVDSQGSSRSSTSYKSDPFALERSMSNASQHTTSVGPNKSYASAGSHHVPTSNTRKADAATKRDWVIE